ncbi:MAG: hypothetical protein ACFE9Z_10785 [Promethearchaeota archaeon]
MSGKIENIVGTGRIEITEKIDLKTLANTFDNTEFDVDKFPGLVMRIGSPKSTVLIFSTGKMVLTGLKKRMMFN